MALKDINNDPRYLPGYELKLKVYDTACHDGQGLKVAADMVFEEPQKLLVIGPGCSNVAIMVAKMLPQWGIPQISWSASAALLNNRKRYPLFYRTVASANMAAMFDQLYMEMGWKRVARLQGDDMREIAIPTSEITILLEIVTGNPDSVRSAIAAIKSKYARIIIVSAFKGNVGRMVLCEAWRQGIYGPRYVWILPFWYKPGWWKPVSEKDDCTEEQAYEVIDGALAIEPGMNNPEDSVGPGGYNNTEFYMRYKTLLRGDRPIGLQYGASMYDALWVAAMGLEGVRHHLDQRLGACCYSDANFSTILSQSLDNVSFVGLSSPSVHFDKNGNVPSLMVVKQYRDGKMKDIGFHQTSKRIKWFMEDVDVTWELTSKGRVRKTDAIWWRNGQRPADSPVRLRLIKSVTLPVYFGVCVLSALCITFTLVAIFFNLSQRHRKVVKLSYPNVSNLILVGGIISYTALFFQAYGRQVPMIFMCKLQIVTLSVGFSTIFGGLFARTWHVYKAFRHKETKGIDIKEKSLFSIIMILNIITIVILVAWFVLDPFHIAKLSETSPDSGDKIIEYVSKTCAPRLNGYFVPILVGFYFCMLLFGCFLAYQTRNVTISTLNDSKAVGVCIYNVFVLATVTFGILMLIRTSDPQLIYIVMSCGVLICTVSTELILFVPKVFHYKDILHISPNVNAEGGLKDSNPRASANPDMISFSRKMLGITHSPPEHLSNDPIVFT